MTLPSALFSSETSSAAASEQWSGGRFDFEASKSLWGPWKSQPHPPTLHPCSINRARGRAAGVENFAVFLHHVPEIKSEKWEDVKRTVYTRWRRSRRSRHLSREAGAFDGLGSLFDLVLVAAPVCGDYLACSCFHMNWKHKKSGKSLINLFNNIGLRKNVSNLCLLYFTWYTNTYTCSDLCDFYEQHIMTDILWPTAHGYVQMTGRSVEIKRWRWSILPGHHQLQTATLLTQPPKMFKIQLFSALAVLMLKTQRLRQILHWIICCECSETISKSNLKTAQDGL